MPHSLPPAQDRSKSLIGRILYSSFAGKISQIPPFSWVTRWLAYRLAIRHIGRKTTVPLRMHSSGLQGALDGIAQDVVEILGFAGAMVATFDNGDVLPVKAFYVDSKLTTPEQIKEWEQQASDLIGSKISLTEPGIARVYIYKKEDQKNLGVRAAHLRKYIISDDLFDLFTPVAPDATKEFVKGVQQALGIQQVITVPFFIESTSTDGAMRTSETGVSNENKPEFVGNLFAAKCTKVTPKDIAVLSTFAQYVASFILSERRRLQVEVIEKLILDIQKSLNSEQDVLQRIVKGIVDDLGYLGAMVATCNQAENVLPVKAIYTGNNIRAEDILAWEKQVSDLIGTPLSLTDSNVAKVYLNQESYKNNLSVKAAQKGRPVSSSELFDLFTPIAPDSAHEFIRGLQDSIGICQVLAVPFFLETANDDGTPCRELLGNLFVVSRSHEIYPWEIEILNAFGQQAAAGLRNVKLYKEAQELYKKAEDRRRSAEIFGKMAFSASASVHALRNQLTSVKLMLQTLEELGNVSQEMRVSILDQIVASQQIPNVLNRVNDMKNLIESLHEPWRPINDTIVNVNTSIRFAVDKIAGSASWVKLSLAEEELNVKTTPEMLLEFFKVLIKNALEAMPDENEQCLEIASKLNTSFIEVVIVDHGTGMDQEILGRIFEMRFTTKERGLGFGLFWARDYVEGLGGSINVRSVVNQGTTFTVLLPRSDCLG